MSIFEHAEFDDHEGVYFVRDRGAGLSAIIAIHDAGPMGMAGGACAGTRAAPRPSETSFASRRPMTYKLALAGIPAGGAKAVIIGDPRTDKTKDFLRAMGRAVQRIGGAYVVGEDVGTTAEDI